MDTLSEKQQFRLKEGCQKLRVQFPSGVSKEVGSALLNVIFFVYSQTEEATRKQGEKDKEYGKTSKTSVKASVEKIAKSFNVPPTQGYDEKSLNAFLVLALTSWKPPDWHKVVEYWKKAVTYSNLSSMSNCTAVSYTFGNTPDEWRRAPPQVQQNALTLLPTYRAGTTGWWLLFGVKTKRGTKNPLEVFLAVPLALDESHQFSPPTDGALPRIHRDWLEPPNPYAEKRRYLGSMDTLDLFFSKHPRVAEDTEWSSYWCYIEDLVETLTAKALEVIHHSAGEDGSELVLKMVCYEDSGLSKGFVRCLDAAAEGKAPLLRHIASPCSTPAALITAIGDLCKVRQKHLGHMDTYDKKSLTRVGFHLEESQRQTINHMAAVNNHELLAVNGPPGTGKTSLLRGVIASEWVRGAIENSTAPLIIAAAATNKAVTNIIESFAEIPGPEMEPTWDSRWLPGLPSYGWYYPAKSHPIEKWENYMTLKVEGKDQALSLLGQAEGFASRIATGTDVLKTDYLRLHARCVGLGIPLLCVADAFRDIRERLKTSVSVMHHIQAELVVLLEHHELLKDDFSEEEQRVSDMDALTQQLAEQHSRQSAIEVKCKHRMKLLDQLTETWADYRKEQVAVRRQKAVADIANRLRAFFDSSVAPAMSERWWTRFTTFVFGKKGERDYARDIRQGIERVEKLSGPESKPPADTQDLRAEICALENALNETTLKVAVILSNRKKIETKMRALVEFRERIAKYADWLAKTAVPVEINIIDCILSLEKRNPCIPGAILAIRVEEWLDKSYRFNHFHMAARYWEGRWLDTSPNTKPERSEAEEKIANLRQMAMLAPVVVATVYTLPNIIYNAFDYADLMIFDEAGQASPEIGCPAFAVAKRAIVVGDVEQLEPIWNITTADDKRLIGEAGLPSPEPGFGWFSASSGSVMAIAQRATAFGPQGWDTKAGLSLRAHYRCRKTIIGYCKELIYKDNLIPSRKEKTEDQFLYPPMSWVAVDGPAPYLEGGSLRNDAQVNEVVGWLADESDRLKAHYGKDLADIVAVIAPYRAQAIAIRDAVSNSKHPSLGPDVSSKMVINTVHALQGAEKPIVAFTLTQDKAPYFVNGYGDVVKPNMLNVAVSRAQDAFILFADTASLKPTEGDEGKKPLGILTRYMAQNGQRLYPRELVFIESAQKKEHIVRALGRRAKVIATGGHFTEVAAWPNGKAPKWTDGDSSFMSELRESLKEAGQLDQFVLATDDDLDGEEIAWHVLRVLHAENGHLADRTIRMRFHALDAPTLRLAREQAMKGVDIRRVQASLLKRLADYRLQQRIKAKTGMHIGRNQVATLRWIAAHSSQKPLRFRLVVNGRVLGQPVKAYPLSSAATTEQSKWMSIEEATSLRNHLENIPTASFLAHKSVLREYPSFPPNTTDRVFISGWRRYKWKPSETGLHLQNVYWGRFLTSIRNSEKP